MFRVEIVQVWRWGLVRRGLCYADKGKIINKDVKDDIGGPPSMLWGGVEWNGV